MLTGLESLRKARVGVREGDLGTLREVYFDDGEWLVRYLIVRTSRSGGRDLLIAPEAVIRVDDNGARVELGLARQQVEDSPPVDFAKPVSRQKAQEYIAYYGWPYFRSAPAGSGSGRARDPAISTIEQEEHWSPHLRSLLEVTSYRLRGSDDHVGHLVDLLADEQNWKIRYLVTSRERVRNAPPWNSRTPLSRDDESRIHDHYGLSPYWSEFAGERPGASP